MITIAKYRNLMAAEVARTRLESRDIQALIADEFFYTLGYGSVIDGVRLQVAEEDAERAKAILASDEYIDLPDDNEVIAETPSAVAESSRTGRWPVWILFLAGIFCLILGRPAGEPRIMPAFSGHLILLGEALIVAGLWILYGRLSNEIDESDIGN